MCGARPCPALLVEARAGRSQAQGLWRAEDFLRDPHALSQVPATGKADAESGSDVEESISDEGTRSPRTSPTQAGEVPGDTSWSFMRKRCRAEGGPSDTGPRGCV